MAVGIMGGGIMAGGIMGGGIMEKESWRRNRGGGVHRRFSPLAQDNYIIMLCDIFNDIFWPNGFHVQTTEHDTLMIRKYEKDIIYIR